jgi:hypothetical protein
MSNRLFSLSFTGAALMLVWGPKKLLLWPMKLRLDLLEHLTDEDILEEVLANNHRYKPEPPFFKNRSWESVIGFNRAACERGRAQHGFNRESHEALAEEWRRCQTETCSLDHAVEFLRQCHRRAPFLFFNVNGNTFADIGRQIAALISAELPTSRRWEVTSAIAHYIAGVLDQESMVEIVNSLCETADWRSGDRSRRCGDHCAVSL